MPATGGRVAEVAGAETVVAGTAAVAGAATAIAR